jgi:hypothetical protein
LGKASLSLKKSASPSYGNLGSIINYTLSFLGTGNTLTLTDTLPQGVSAPNNFELIGTTITPGYNSGQHRLTWSDMPPVGQKVTIRYSVMITAAQTASLVNMAVLNGTGSDPSTAQATVTVNGQLVYIPLIHKKVKNQE